MVISSPTRSVVRSAIKGVFDSVGYSYGVPFVTTEGFVLFTSDDDILISVERGAATGKSRLPIISDDNFLILTNENSTILGA